MATTESRRSYYLARDEGDVLREVDEMLEVLERSLEQSLKRKKRTGAISDFKERLEAIERRLEVLERWQKKHERTLERALGTRSSR
jgi:DNA-binding transcriptional regulator GbsR (MarR family)